MCLCVHEHHYESPFDFQTQLRQLTCTTVLCGVVALLTVATRGSATAEELRVPASTLCVPLIPGLLLLLVVTLVAEGSRRGPDCCASSCCEFSIEFTPEFAPEFAGWFFIILCRRSCVILMAMPIMPMISIAMKLKMPMSCPRLSAESPDLVTVSEASCSVCCVVDDEGEVGSLRTSGLLELLWNTLELGGRVAFGASGSESACMQRLSVKWNRTERTLPFESERDLKQ